MDQMWIACKKILEKYPKIFSQETLNFDLFEWAYCISVTRTFGSDLPSGTLMPMADNFNHNNCMNNWELINKKLHREYDLLSSYAQIQK
jgi:hypothetical protein